jgi:hypothetical protein
MGTQGNQRDISINHLKFKFKIKLLIGTVGDAASGPAAAAPVQEEPLVGVAEGETFGELIPFGDPYWYQDQVSPYYKETHRRLRSYVRNFVEKEIMPFCHECMVLFFF